MIRFIFYRTKKKTLKGFLVEGHAGFSNIGQDIVCAGVSAIVEMCCNAITDILKKKVLIECIEGRIFLKIYEEDISVEMFLKALEMEVILLQKQYRENISLKYMEE